MDALSFTGLHFTYPSGVEALRGVTFSVPVGQRLAIIGQNGAGKTTLVRHLNGIFRPTSGEVRLAAATTGKSIAELSAQVGYVFQNPDEQIFANTIRADVEFGPRNLGLEDPSARALEALETVGLVVHADEHPHHLSLSERKRVALAGVLAMQTPIVVLDEPTTGQDAGGVAMIARIVHDIAAQGRTVVAITHDMDFCAEHFERVIVMSLGEVIADGTPQEVFSDAGTLARAAVEPPALIRLAQELGWADRPVSVLEFVDAAALR